MSQVYTCTSLARIPNFGEDSGVENNFSLRTNERTHLFSSQNRRGPGEGGGGREWRVRGGAVRGRGVTLSQASWPRKKSGNTPSNLYSDYCSVEYKRPLSFRRLLSFLSFFLNHFSQASARKSS